MTKILHLSALLAAGHSAQAFKISNFDTNVVHEATRWWQTLQNRITERINNDENRKLFDQLVERFDKVYQDKQDEIQHFQQFIANLERVELNPNMTIFNQFFDEDREEFRRKRLAKTMTSGQYHENPVKKQLLEPVAGGAAVWPIDIPGWIKECAQDQSCGLESIEFPWDCMEAPQFDEVEGGYPATVDWTTKENPLKTIAVTPVKDQGICGSCYTFAGTGALEGLMLREKKVKGTKRKGGHTLGNKIWAGLSEQELLDCTNINRAEYGPFVNHGCSGGWPANVFLFATVRERISHGDDYPYTGTPGTCQYADDSTTAMKGSWFPGVCYSTQKNDEEQLMKALYHHGPIAVIVDASLQEFQLYQQGVIDPAGCSKDSLNHAMLLVGYGEENGEKFWKVRNSWGNWWGEDGYIKLARNGQNTCGITSVATYVTSDSYFG